MDAVTLANQGFDWSSILSLFLNLVLGGGIIVTLFTLRSTKKKMSAEADNAQAQVKTTEIDNEGKQIDNAEKLITLWEQYAEKRSAADAEQIKVFSEQVVTLTKAISRLTKAINKTKECKWADECPVQNELKKDIES